ncbi:hypothetical protein [Pseudomonas panipatensis]|uniref:Uncharacterized protein n=1 Tax=Pseudomonas panipatensis TaxID=428992 RepID=A0A1G8CWF6_9PSED|nr:hypothetical protein [Pseudomonas panipatensis]SDH49684.1 hypothetical protein SAMN05216272_101800 [Pseudomonas panipatensis]SMP63308.1 hypothetical protein SAMN06295951_10642 [Pseudomonas panipatensis]
MLTHDTAAGWSKARRPLDPARRSEWGAVAAKEASAAGPWGRAEILDASQVGSWDAAPQIDQQQASAWSRVAGRDIGTGGRWDTVAQKDLARRLGWDRSITPQDVRLRLLYSPRPALKDTLSGQAWYRCDEFGERFDAAAERAASLYIPVAGLVEFSFSGQRYVPSTTASVFFDFHYTAQQHAIQPVDSGLSVRFTPARILEQMRTMPWGWGTPTDPKPTGIVYPDYPGPVVVIDPPQEPDILETYMIANTVTLVVLPSGTPLDATNIRANLDIDSFAWSFSAELFGRTSLNLVVPDANGPKTVELTINGWVWRFLVERYSGSGKHPSERYSISGSSRTQLLDAPYAPQRSGLNAAMVSARNIIDDQLQNTGFSASWDTVGMGPPDWTLPAGAFSYQSQTPMQIIHRLAEVAGAVVRPEMAADGFTVLPRYREATWYWGGAVPDCIIPTEIVAEWGSEWSPQPQWNFVYVSGANYGVGVQVRRAGTAGDEPAADVIDDWITTVDVARSRGICELSKGGNQAIETRRIPLFEKGGSAPGLVLPAMLTECRDDDTTWRGLCLGTEISADGVGASRVWQTLKIERHYGSGN